MPTCYLSLFVFLITPWLKHEYTTSLVSSWSAQLFKACYIREFNVLLPIANPVFCLFFWCNITAFNLLQIEATKCGKKKKVSSVCCLKFAYVICKARRHTIYMFHPLYWNIAQPVKTSDISTYNDMSARCPVPWLNMIYYFEQSELLVYLVHFHDPDTLSVVHMWLSEM